ncbi:hypothetical protein PR048_006882 [Dryococelus australis]|uniref:Uncharacterized protein n=1 Tax=Dryococelus australis TaxID=614101 RepID=A0ABQ9IC76_9NEOP|nr:hypothetical protein PR048_006882 [Dryococelus australis]
MADKICSMCDGYLRHAHHSQLLGRTQRPGEPLQEIWQDIVRLSHLSLEGSPEEARDIIALGFFVDAIADTEVRQAVRLAAHHNMQGTLARAQEVEAARQMAAPHNMQGTLARAQEVEAARQMAAPRRTVRALTLNKNEVRITMTLNKSQLALRFEHLRTYCPQQKQQPVKRQRGEEQMASVRTYKHLREKVRELRAYAQQLRHRIDELMLQAAHLTKQLENAHDDLRVLSRSHVHTVPYNSERCPWHGASDRTASLSVVSLRIAVLVVPCRKWFGGQRTHCVNSRKGMMQSTEATSASWYVGRGSSHDLLHPPQVPALFRLRRKRYWNLQKSWEGLYTILKINDVIFRICLQGSRAEPVTRSLLRIPREQVEVKDSSYMMAAAERPMIVLNGEASVKPVATYLSYTSIVTQECHRYHYLPQNNLDCREPERFASGATLSNSWSGKGRMQLSARVRGELVCSEEWDWSAGLWIGFDELSYTIKISRRQNQSSFVHGAIFPIPLGRAHMCGQNHCGAAATCALVHISQALVERICGVNSGAARTLSARVHTDNKKLCRIVPFVTAENFESLFDENERNTNRVRVPAGSLPDFRIRECRAGRFLWSVDFLGDLQFPPPLYSGAAPYSLRFTLIGSKDLEVKNHPNICTLRIERILNVDTVAVPFGNKISYVSACWWDVPGKAGKPQDKWHVGTQTSLYPASSDGDVYEILADGKSSDMKASSAKVVADTEEKEIFIRKAFDCMIGLRPLRTVLMPVHYKVSSFEINLRKKSLLLPAYVLTGVLSDMRPVKLVTKKGDLVILEWNILEKKRNDSAGVCLIERLRKHDKKKSQTVELYVKNMSHLNGGSSCLPGTPLLRWQRDQQKRWINLLYRVQTSALSIYRHPTSPISVVELEWSRYLREHHPPQPPSLPLSSALEQGVAARGDDLNPLSPRSVAHLFLADLSPEVVVSSEAARPTSELVRLASRLEEASRLSLEADSTLKLTSKGVVPKEDIDNDADVVADIVGGGSKLGVGKVSKLKMPDCGLVLITMNTVLDPTKILRDSRLMTVSAVTD